MDWLKGITWFSKKSREVEEERFLSFLENGGKLLEGLVASSDGRYGVPYRNFTAEELIRATTDFKDLVMFDGNGNFYGGFFNERSVLVKRFYDRGDNLDMLSYVINDIVISLLMSRHKNVFKLLGCCLEFRTPALVYEYSENNTRLLSDILYQRKDGSTSNDDDSLTWRVRLKLAVDIANALVYLHSEFATPIIHRDLCMHNIVICSDGVAKLLDFSLCISLPPGEAQVEDRVIGVTGHGEPEYICSGIITEKTDVYMFGALLLGLLTGQRSLDSSREPIDLVDLVKDHIVNNQLERILDPVLLAEKGGNEQEHKQQKQALAELALRCTQSTGKDRPDMISVAKELTQIKRFVHFH